MRFTTSFALGFVMVAAVEAAGAKKDEGGGVMGTANDGETMLPEIKNSPLGNKKMDSVFSFSSVFKFSASHVSASASTSVPLVSVDVDGGSDGLFDAGCGDGDGTIDITSLVAVGPPPVDDLYLDSDHINQILHATRKVNDYGIHLSVDDLSQCYVLDGESGDQARCLTLIVKDFIGEGKVITVIENDDEVLKLQQGAKYKEISRKPVASSFSKLVRRCLTAVGLGTKDVPTSVSTFVVRPKASKVKLAIQLALRKVIAFLPAKVSAAIEHVLGLAETVPQKLTYDADHTSKTNTNAHNADAWPYADDGASGYASNSDAKFAEDVVDTDRAVVASRSVRSSQKPDRVTSPSSAFITTAITILPTPKPVVTELAVFDANQEVSIDDHVRAMKARLIATFVETMGGGIDAVITRTVDLPATATAMMYEKMEKVMEEGTGENVNFAIVFMVSSSFIGLFIALRGITRLRAVLRPSVPLPLKNANNAVILRAADIHRPYNRLAWLFQITYDFRNSTVSVVLKDSRDGTLVETRWVYTFPTTRGLAIAYYCRTVVKYSPSALHKFVTALEQTLRSQGDEELTRFGEHLFEAGDMPSITLSVFNLILNSVTADRIPLLYRSCARPTPTTATLVGALGGSRFSTILLTTRIMRPLVRVEPTSQSLELLPISTAETTPLFCLGRAPQPVSAVIFPLFPAETPSPPPPPPSPIPSAPLAPAPSSADPVSGTELAVTPPVGDDSALDFESIGSFPKGVRWDEVDDDDEVTFSDSKPVNASPPESEKLAPNVGLSSQTVLAPSIPSDSPSLPPREAVIVSTTDLEQSSEGKKPTSSPSSSPTSPSPPPSFDGDDASTSRGPSPNQEAELASAFDEFLEDENANDDTETDAVSSSCEDLSKVLDNYVTSPDDTSYDVDVSSDIDSPSAPSPPSPSSVTSTDDAVSVVPRMTEVAEAPQSHPEPTAVTETATAAHAPSEDSPLVDSSLTPPQTGDLPIVPMSLSQWEAAVDVIKKIKNHESTLETLRNKRKAYPDMSREGAMKYLKASYTDRIYPGPAPLSRSSTTRRPSPRQVRLMYDRLLQAAVSAPPKSRAASPQVKGSEQEPKGSPKGTSAVIAEETSPSAAEVCSSKTPEVVFASTTKPAGLAWPKGIPNDPSVPPIAPPCANSTSSPAPLAATSSNSVSSPPSATSVNTPSPKASSMWAPLEKTTIGSASPSPSPRSTVIGTPTSATDAPPSTCPPTTPSPILAKPQVAFPRGIAQIVDTPVPFKEEEVVKKSHKVGVPLVIPPRGPSMWDPATTAATPIATSSPPVVSATTAPKCDVSSACAPIIVKGRGSRKTRAPALTDEAPNTAAEPAALVGPLPAPRGRENKALVATEHRPSTPSSTPAPVPRGRNRAKTQAPAPGQAPPAAAVATAGHRDDGYSRGGGVRSGYGLKAPPAPKDESRWAHDLHPKGAGRKRR